MVRAVRSFTRILNEAYHTGESVFVADCSALIASLLNRARSGVHLRGVRVGAQETCVGDGGRGSGRKQLELF